jgi:single-strand DNA-binding protein
MSGIEAAFFGCLGRDAEAKISKPGKPYLRLNVRVGDGDAVQWVNITCFDPDAIAVADKLVKGARVYVEGSIKLDKWTAADGAERTGLSAMSWHCRLSHIGRNKPKHSNKISGAGGANQPNASGGFYSDDIPFAPEWR